MRPFLRPLLLAAAVLALPLGARAQAPLFLANEQTTVSAVDFTFEDTQTFSERELRAILATKGPSAGDRAKRRAGNTLPFLKPLLRTKPQRLERIEVQKDVVRLRDFYRLNGFFETEVDYPASQLDTARNSLRVVYSIREGRPVRVRALSLFAQDSTGRDVAFPAELERQWRTLDDATTLQPGARFTSVDYAILKGQVLDWALNHGYPFARVRGDSTLRLDSLAIDLALTLVPGPRARVSQIDIEGNRSVSDAIVARELPLQEGDYFSQRRLVEGQREVFALPLFRAASGVVPPQPVDSTVRVVYTVREAPLRRLSALTGYSREDGVLVQADWTHRNFLGEARQLTVSALARTGVGAFPVDGVAARRFNLTATLRQPYLFNRNTSGTVGPFLFAEDDPNLGNRYAEVGGTATVLHELMEFRTLSLAYTFGRVLPLVGEFGQGVALTEGLVYNRSVFTASATLGRVNSFLNPRRGYLVRPSVEYAGGVIGSGVNYTKLAAEGTAYTTLSRRIDGAARLYAGRLVPYGASRNQLDPIVEARFDRIRFYAGGASDVRGWNLNQLGPQWLLVDSVYRARPATPGVLDSLTVQNGRYEAVGGLTKLAANLEARMPFPGLSANWRLAAFTDAGLVSERALDLGQLRVGAGAGVRYLTPVGYLRFDLAYKLNPSETDLYTPLQLYERRYGVDLPDVDQPGWFGRLWRRLAIHLSIGQAF